MEVVEGSRGLKHNESIGERTLIFFRMITAKDADEFNQCYWLLTGRKNFGQWNRMQKTKIVKDIYLK